MAWWKQEPTIPQNAGQLTAWLRDTIEGRNIVREAADGLLEERCRDCAAVYRRPKVLVVARRLGGYTGVEVFAEKGVAVRIEEMVDTRDSPAMERTAEELLVEQLPAAWKSLPDCPGYLRDTQIFSGMSESEWREWQANLDWLALLREYKKTNDRADSLG